MADKVKHATVHGVEGDGATATEAKADARQKLDALVERVKLGPSVFHVHGLVALVWPDDFGWATRIDNPSKPPAQRGEMWGSCSGYRTREEAVLGVLLHAGQCAWNHGISPRGVYPADVTPDEMHAVETFNQLPHWIPSWLRLDKVQELYKWTQWQRDYKRLRDLGATDGEAHEHAGRGDGWTPEAARKAAA